MERSPYWETNRFSASQKITHFIKPEGSLPHSQVPATCPYPDAARSSPYPKSHFLKMHLTKYHVPFSFFVCIKVSVGLRSLLVDCFATCCFLRWGVVSTSPNPQTGRPPIVGCPRLLIQYIRSYPAYWRPFLHPHPEDAPCRGDRDLLNTARSRVPET